MKNLMIIPLCICLVLSFTACLGRNNDDTSIPQNSPESVGAEVIDKETAEPLNSQPDLIQIENILPLFDEKVKSDFGLDVQNTEPLGEVPVEDEIWYKFRVTTEYESIIYLLNADISRIYWQISKERNSLYTAMYEVYISVDDPVLLVSQEELRRLQALLLDKLVSDVGPDASGMNGDISIINNEFCLMLTAVHIKDMEYTYIATYAISLDGERYYKLGDDGFFHTM